MYGKDDKVLVISYNSFQRKNPTLKMYVLSQYCTNFCENARLKAIVEVNKIKAYRLKKTIIIIAFICHMSQNLNFTKTGS